MGWLSGLFGGEADREVGLTAAQRQALVDWRKLPAADPGLPHFQTRYVVVDVETSGLNMEKDRLISIGAVAVVNGLIEINDAFEVVLRQDAASTDQNILIHGIGGTEQRGGIDPADALLAFLAYLGNSQLVAYHASFDKRMIRRAMSEYLGIPFEKSWIDLAWILPELFGEHGFEQIGLDGWLNVFGIENIVRHNAVSDAYATANLLQIAIARGKLRNAESPKHFAEVEKARRLLRGSE